MDAIEKVMNRYIEIFASMQNEYMAQRAADIKDIKGQLQRQIQGIALPDTSELTEPTVIVSEDIPPSVTAGLDFEHVAGMVMEGGGRTSHTAILARTIEIPAAVGVKGILDEVQNGMYLALDGDSGEVFLEPDEETVQEFRRKIEEEKAYKRRQQERIHEPCVTRDGRHFQLFGNIGNAQDAEKAAYYGAEGSG